MDIKVLGSGCPNCKKVEALAREAISELRAEARIEHVTDFQTILSYGIMATPGLVVDGAVKSAGRVPTRAEITSWVASALAKG